MGNNGLKLDASDRIFSQSNALLDFIPGRIRQQDFVSVYNPAIVTIGIGGNDAGLMGKLQDCAGSGTCKWVSDPKLREQTAIEIRGLFEKLRYTYSELSNKSPISKIVAIGYPMIIDTKGVCPSYVGQMYNNLERDFVYESISYLNRVIKSAAKSAGVGYIDVENALEGHTLCGLGPNSVNAIRLGDDLGIFGNESFHPNAYGHNLIADRINNVVGNILSYSYCPNGANICPDTKVIAPFPPLYWLPEGEHPYARLQEADFAKEGSDYRHRNIFFDSYAFKPDSIISITAMSETINLGEYSASGDGSLNVGIELPENFEEGDHTLFIQGTSYSGEQIDLYQMFTFRKPTISLDDTESENTTNSDTINRGTNSTDFNEEKGSGETETSTEKGFAEIVNNSIDTGVKGASTIKKLSKVDAKSDKMNIVNTSKVAVTVSLIIVFSLILIKSWAILRNKSK